MAENSKIEWCTHSASPWHGCQHAGDHPGCQRCYAEAMAKRNPKTLGVWGPNGTRVVSKSFAANCRRWNKQAEAAGVRQSVFPSICDPFEDWQGRLHFVEKDQDTGATENTVAWWRRDIGVCRAGQTTVGHVLGERLATMDDLRRDLFRVIDSCPWLDFLLLTKRPENVRRMWPYLWGGDEHKPTRAAPDRPNVWLGTSISDQATADKYVPELLKCRDLAPVLFLSAEPLLGSVDLSDDEQATYCHWAGQVVPGECEHGMACRPRCYLNGVDWVIVGGESGHGARSCDVAWIGSIVRQCDSANVPCFVKQLGPAPFSTTKPNDWPDGVVCSKEYHRDYGDCWLFQLKHSKGGDPLEWPDDLRVRQMPEVHAHA